MIRACLFDMGKVLVEFSHDQMLEQLAVVFGCKPAEMREYLYDSGLLLKYEKGLIEEDALHSLLEQQFACQVKRHDLKLAAADIFQEKEEMIPLLQELRQLGMRLVLLSNTSRIHFEFIRERFEILNYFDAYILSYEVKAMKPEPAIYEAALQAAGFPAQHCFFTDDIAENIAGARQLGIHAELFQNREQITAALREFAVPLS